MKCTVDPVLLDKVVKKLSSIEKPNDGNPQINVSVTQDEMSLSRDDHQHKCVISIKCLTEQVGSVILEWGKFKGIAVSAASSAPVRISDEAGSTVEFVQGKAIKIKVPIIVAGSSMSYAAAENWIPIDGIFLNALKAASALCTDKIVGRGRYSGIFVHEYRLVSSSHDGVMELTENFGVPSKFAIPYGSVWTLLNFVNSAEVSIGYALNPTQGGLKSVNIRGKLDEMSWVFSCGYHAPSHSFAALNLLEQIPVVEKVGFSFSVLALAFVHALDHVSSIQGKSEVSVTLASISESGMIIESTDLSKSSQAKCSVVISGFMGKVLGAITTKRTSLQAILKGFGSADIKIAWDEAASHLVFDDDNGMVAVLACSLKK